MYFTLSSWLRTAPREDETDPAAWNNRGNALLGLRRFQEAKDIVGA